MELFRLSSKYATDEKIIFEARNLSLTYAHDLNELLSRARRDIIEYDSREDYYKVTIDAKFIANEETITTLCKRLLQYKERDRETLAFARAMHTQAYNLRKDYTVLQDCLEQVIVKVISTIMTKDCDYNDKDCNIFRNKREKETYAALMKIYDAKKRVSVEELREVFLAAIIDKALFSCGYCAYTIQRVDENNIYYRTRVFDGHVIQTIFRVVVTDNDNDKIITNKIF